MNEVGPVNMWWFLGFISIRAKTDACSTLGWATAAMIDFDELDRVDPDATLRVGLGHMRVQLSSPSLTILGCC